jgi:hypothetical protein
MHPQLNPLLAAISGMAPLHLRSRDKWGWGPTGAYTSKQGFVALQAQHSRIHTSTLWQHVWDPFGLPKINFFCWVLMHRRVLTGDNLAKRGIIGPHRCPLCCSAQKTLDHLFIDCPFTQEIWTQAMHGLNSQTPSQLTVVNVFTSWKGRSPHVLKRKSM